MRRLVVLLFLLLTMPAFSQTKRPFTFEDMMKLKRVGEPEPSRDGKWVLFSAVDVDLAANTKTPHVWIVPLGGGQEREIISDQDADRPRWAPDGKRFAFISTKEEGSQVWIADFDSAAGSVTGVHKLTALATEASGEVWTPDGKNIIFTSDVYPECDAAPAEEQDCNAKKHKEVENSKVKAIIFDRLLYRHWNMYKRGTRTHIFVVADVLASARSTPGAGIAPPPPRDLTPGDYDAPVFSLGGQDNYALSPDGQELCYTSNHDQVEATSTNNNLWIVPVNADAGATPADVLAKTRNITADNPASDSTPLYSPDGKYIAYRAQQRPGYESDRFRLILYERKTGEKKDLTGDFDGWVGDFTWWRNVVFFSSEREGESPIFYVSQGDKFPTKVLDGFNGDLTSFESGLLFTRMTLQAPMQIFSSEFSSSAACDGRSGKQGARSQTTDGGCKEGPMGLRLTRQLSHLNDTVLTQVSMPPLESFWFTGARGEKVQGFLVKPPDFDPNKKYPVKFLIHGGPEGEWGDDWSYRWNPELFAANGYVVVMINFHGSTGYGQKFIDAINGDWGGAPFEDLMKGLDYAEKTYPFIDKDRECALGASYGGYMANWVLGHTDRFKCIVSHDGMFNPVSAWGTTEELWFNNWEFKGTPYTNPEMYEKWAPRNSAKNFKTPTLVIHGQLDYRLDLSEGLQLFTTLQIMGVPSKMLYFPDEGHWVLKPQNSQLWYKTVNDWVDQWIQKQATKK
jgi:dipeptidyl aminopeptidase/acylaminoacyl peptidase